MKNLNIIVIFLALTIFNLAICSVLYIQGSKYYKNLIYEKLEASVTSFEILLDPIKLNKLLSTDSQDNDPLYQETISNLEVAHLKAKNIKYVYTLHKHKNQIKFGLDTAPRSKIESTGVPNHSDLNSNYDEAPDYVKEAFDNKKTVISHKPYSDKWGTFIGIFKPIFFEGKLISLLCVEIDYSQYHSTLMKFWYFIIGLFITFLLFTITLCFFVKREEKRLLQEKEYTLEIQNKEKILNSEAKMADVGRMMAGINHEINNPLQIILGFSQMGKKLLDREADAQEFNKIFNKIEHSVRRVTDIIAFMKELIKNDSNIEFKPHNCKDLINEVSLFTDLKSKEYNIKINIIDVPDQDIMCKKISIQQVLINLITNSIDVIKTHKEPWINIYYSQDDNYHYFKIEDSGLGISPEEQIKINKGYYTTKSNGSGLGLLLCKKIAELHGGELKYVGAKHTAFQLSLKKSIS